MKTPIPACFLLCFLAFAFSVAALEGPIPRDQETKEVQGLLGKQNEFRRDFLNELQKEAGEIRTRLDSASGEDERKDIIEQFRTHQLKRIEEFQERDDALTKEIENARSNSKLP